MTLVSFVVGLIACTVAFIGGMRFGISVQLGHDQDRVFRILRLMTTHARNEYENAALSVQVEELAQ